MDKDKTVEQAAQQLREARARYDGMHREYEAARSRETDALNALNRAQKTFDEAVAALKKDAPWNSDWHSRNRRGAEGACTGSAPPADATGTPMSCASAAHGAPGKGSPAAPGPTNA